MSDDPRRFPMQRADEPRSVDVGIVLAGQAQRRFGALDGHQRLGESVPHGLETGDRSAELDPVECMLAGQGQHRPG